MNTIFNSLGSNYNFEFVLKSLFASNNEDNKTTLINFLNKKYNGKTILLYKGREAIKLVLDILKLPKNSKVGITGFTCYAVYKAVTDAGLLPEYLDIEGTSLNFSLDEVKKHKNLKVLIIQNTLGNPCDILNLKKYCLENRIVLIEDLAHSVGTIYKGGKEAGYCGDFVVLSFGQDKIIDAVSGGALIIKNTKFRDIGNIGFRPVSMVRQLKDRLYPLFTFKIRKTYKIGLGKVLHYLLKKSNLLSKPMDGNSPIVLHSLPNWYCGLVNFQFSELNNEIKHRKKIINIYREKFSKYGSSFSLRFPVFVKNRKVLIDHLKQNGIYITDIWYDAPIAPFRFLKLTNYKIGMCPTSEKISEEIVNLPTHINISESDAERVSAIINIWLNIQKN